MADSPISAELSKMIRDRRVAKRREGWETAGRVAGGVGDVFTGGAVSRAKRAWTPFEDKPLTLREKIGLTEQVIARDKAQKEALQALKEGNMKAYQKARKEQQDREDKLNMAEYRGRVSLAQTNATAEGNIEKLLTQRALEIDGMMGGVINERDAQKILNEYQAKGFPPEGNARIDYVKELAEDLLRTDPLTAASVLKELGADVEAHITNPQNAHNVESVGQLQNKLALGAMSAEELALQKEIVEQDIAASQKKRRGQGAKLKRGEAAPAAGTFDSSEVAGSSSEIDPYREFDYGTGDDAVRQDLLDYRSEVPESRKQSEILYDQLLASPELMAIAQDQGIDINNAVQGAHFMEQVNKSQKLSERAYKKARRRGVDPSKVLAKKARGARRLSELLTFGAAGEDGHISDRQMRVQLAQLFMGISPEHMDTYLQKHRKNKAQDKLELEAEGLPEETPSIVEPTTPLPTMGDLREGAVDSAEISELSSSELDADPYADPEMVYPEPEDKSDSGFTQALRASKRRSRRLGAEIEDELAEKADAVQ